MSSADMRGDGHLVNSGCVMHLAWSLRVRWSRLVSRRTSATNRMYTMRACSATAILLPSHQ